MALFAEWPWVNRLLWTAAIVAIAYGIGLVIRAIVGARFGRIAHRTPWVWDDALVALSHRIPFWAVLVGAYFSLRRWQLSTEDYLHAVHLISALAVASFTFALAGVATRLVSSYGPRAAPDAPVSALVQNIVRFVVVVLGLLVIVRSFGFEITPYLTALGVGGLAVALALQDPLSNLFAGIFMSVSGQVQIGDYVRLDGGAEGYVADFNWRATSIRMLANNVIIVPNVKLAQATVTNFHQPTREIAIGVDVIVHYLSDLDKVERVTLEVARQVMADTPGAVRDVDPAVRFASFGATGIQLSVGMRGQEFTDQFLIKHTLIKRLHARYEEEDIVIPFPVTPAEFRNLLPGDEPGKKV